MTGDLPSRPAGYDDDAAPADDDDGWVASPAVGEGETDPSPSGLAER